MQHGEAQNHRPQAQEQLQNQKALSPVPNLWFLKSLPFLNQLWIALVSACARVGAADPSRDPLSCHFAYELCKYCCSWTCSQASRNLSPPEISAAHPSGIWSQQASLVDLLWTGKAHLLSHLGPSLPGVAMSAEWCWSAEWTEHILLFVNWFKWTECLTDWGFQLCKERSLNFLLWHARFSADPLI